MATDTPAPRKPRAKTATKAPAAASAATTAMPKTAKPKSAPRAATPARPVRAQIAATGETMRTEAQRKIAQLGDEMARLYAQAGERAGDMARQGKGKAADGLSSLARTIDDSAATVDDRLGKQYGDFARSAAGTVASLAGTLEQQDLDELLASTRDFVKKSPAVAIGSAAVVGFMLARLMRGSNHD
jgi:ElaB/YqjD/DUF883 family membrane-anchored ribosome-binding protein